MSESPDGLSLADEEATLACGRRLGTVLSRQPVAAPFVVHLTGELGAGKTTLVRGMLRALAFAGTIRSPTYTLLETYDVGALTVAHLDLYRLQHPAEVEELALSELLLPGHVLFIEWPRKGGGHVPDADLEIELRFAAAGRILHAAAHSGAAEPVVQQWFR